MKISIPVPCREDRAAMSATETGAWCQKCAHDVIDFTKKTPEEIRKTLQLHGKTRVCGFITPLQMELVNSDFHVWENQPAKVFQSKFIYACVIVFGLSLFACENQPETEDELKSLQSITTGIMADESDTSCVSTDHYGSDTTNTGEYSFTTDFKGRISSE